MAIGLLVVGIGMLVLNRRIALYWSKVQNRPVPRGLFYFYLYIAGPIFLVVMGMLALLSGLFLK
ncbi:MAG TPA: hypothetical protein VGS16_00670 [Candidatus Dormibacteraeota bacterium]|nr:hypothetical protein [Candidatus Dormibacteraeota bacterium]